MTKLEAETAEISGGDRGEERAVLKVKVKARGGRAVGGRQKRRGQLKGQLYFQRAMDPDMALTGVAVGSGC